MDDSEPLEDDNVMTLYKTASTCTVYVLCKVDGVDTFVRVYGQR